MTGTKSDWPANRYKRRMALRLRRKNYNKSHGKGSNLPDPPADCAAAGTALEPAVNEAAEKQREQMLRLQAEFENYRRRMRKEIEEIKATANAGLLEVLIPVVDNFERALKNPVTSLDGFVDGIRMINGQFANLMREAGLEKISPQGEPFDPKMHEAVAVDASGETPDNHVAEVFQDGYVLKGKLIRPAMVKVSRHG